MAWNWKTFNTRALTALLFAAVMLAGLLINEWTFLLLFTVIHFGCWYEYQKLVGLIDEGYRSIHPLHRYGVMLGFQPDAVPYQRLVHYLLCFVVFYWLDAGIGKCVCTACD